jgi:hypothetical protein
MNWPLNLQVGKTFTGNRLLQVIHKKRETAISNILNLGKLGVTIVQFDWFLVNNFWTMAM